MNEKIQPPAKMGLKQIVQSEDFGAQLALVMPAHLSPEMVARVAVTAMTKTPKLAQCTPVSVCSCLLDLTAAGLVPDGRRAHLIPRGDECTLLIDYKGLIEIILRNENVQKVHADIICENDTFEHSRGEVKEHTYPIFIDRGEPIACYAEIVHKDGGRQAVIMSKAEVQAVRDKSGYSHGPWKTDPLEMWKKTAIRRLSKYITLPSSVIGALNADDARPVNLATIPTESVNSSQAADLQDLCLESGIVDTDFLARYNAENFDTFPADHYAKARGVLQLRIENNKTREGKE